ncbi:MAG: aminopeptidase [Hespellia sp.]|nr:aminopeptidase [Hespellia sp.]
MTIQEELQQENELAGERYQLAIDRIREIKQEDIIDARMQPYFQSLAAFLLKIDEIKGLLEDNQWQELTLEEMQKINHSLYEDILPGQYEQSFANPAYAKKEILEPYGQLLSFVYTELRSAITFVFEGNIQYLAICNELFLEIYASFEDGLPEYKGLKDIVYWYASDYCDVFLADRIREQIYPEYSFAFDIIMKSDLDDLRYLYRYGEYVTENELESARHLGSLPDETIQRMADVYTEGYRVGFVNTGKDLSKKEVVNVRYHLGFERVVRQSILNFEKIKLRPSIYRAAVSVITKRGQSKVGYCGAIANKQYEYDHRADEGIFLDKKYIERKLDVTKNVYEENKDAARLFAGPAVMEIFGEAPFAPEKKREAVELTDYQRQCSLQYDSKSTQIVNQYIPGEERSFTIIAYPIPEIGERYREIFDEVIRINTLDAKVYEKVQQTLIDALDEGAYVQVLGKAPNKTNLRVQLHPLADPEHETIFENCVADVNIPVGEVFTSPMLEGTNGVLHVSKVYLNELQYQNLEITFSEGMIADYGCTNFENPEDGRKYIADNILHNHESLPIGEFAIGTNTTAYVVAKKYQMEEKMPILIAEKMGPHFAVGDTCYSWSEDIKVYNPNGKEIVARDNSVSLLRKEDPEKAYFQCHTDITIPYEELEEISVYTKAGKNIILLKNGRFVLEGTEILNEPLKELGSL